MAEKMPRHTSDECHTPPDVYQALADWVVDRFGLNRSTFCRPLYPGGDYQSFDYSGRIVVDNPPFSILSKILHFYDENNIRFFLFAPALTAFPSAFYLNFSHIFVGRANNITYDNGASISTHFVTNLFEKPIICSDKYLEKSILKQPSQQSKALKKTTMADDEFHGARCQTLSKYYDFIIPCDEVEWAGKTAEGKKMFGGGFRLKKEGQNSWRSASAR